MKRAAQKIEEIFAAVAFAEAGEHDTAREIAEAGRDKDDDQEERPLLTPDLETV